MRTIILVAFLSCLSVALATVGDRCKTNEECDELECCLQGIMKKTCQKLRKEDEFCFPSEKWNAGEGFYKFMCPCESGLECKAEETKQEGSVTKFVNSKCTKA